MTKPLVRHAANQGRIGNYNQTVVLDAIRRATDGVSRVELAAATGLSAQAVTNIVRLLIGNDLIIEGRKQRTQGKPRTMLHLNPDGQYAVGVHLDPSEITYVILDLVGDTIARARRRTPLSPAPDVVTAEIANQVETLINDTGIDRSKVVGVGIAAPGPIDVDRGVLLDPPNLVGWQAVPLRDALRDAVGLPVLMEKDVTAAAMAEKWHADGQNLLFFYLGTGVGAGLVLGQELFRGRTHNSGEIGNIVVDNDGAPCPCGYRGCVGASNRPQSLVHRALSARAIDGEVDLDDRQQLEQALVQLAGNASAGREAAVEVMDSLVRGFLKAAEDIALLLDLDQVIFGGPRWAILEPFFTEERLAVLQRRFAGHATHALQVSGTRIGVDVGAVGAASLVLDHTFSLSPAVLFAP